MLPPPRLPVTANDRLEMASMVKELLGDDKAIAWWGAPNPMFGGIAPCWMIGSSAEAKLRDFIFNSWAAKNADRETEVRDDR